MLKSLQSWRKQMQFARFQFLNPLTLLFPLYVHSLVMYETHSGEICQAVGSDDGDDDDTWSDA